MEHCFDPWSSSSLSSPNFLVSAPLLPCRYSGLIIGRSSEVPQKQVEWRYHREFHLQHTPSAVSSPHPPFAFPDLSTVAVPRSAWVGQPSILAHDACADLGLYASTHPITSPLKVPQSPSPTHQASTLSGASPRDYILPLLGSNTWEIPRLTPPASV